MRKLFQLDKFKKAQRRKFKRKKRNNKFQLELNFNNVNPNREKQNQEKFPIIIEAPIDLRFMVNTENCVNFINRIDDSRNYGKQRNTLYVRLSFSKVKTIDYSMISILIALVGELKNKSILTVIDSKIDSEIRSYMIDSGLFKDFFDEQGKRFYVSKKSSHIFFEKGTGVLRREDLLSMVSIVEKIHLHLLNKKGFCLRLNTILKEVCGNSVEWSGEKKQWLLGTKYEKDKVIVTITDLGKGILSTLNSKYSDVLKKIQNKDDEILIGAFNKKYGSKSKKVNRNKGLPCVRISNEENKISGLKVVTNNVRIDFNNFDNNKVFTEHVHFKGTQYRFEINSINLH